MSPTHSLRTLDAPTGGKLMLRRMPTLDMPPTENPPRFAWLPDIDSGARYALRVRALYNDAPARVLATGLRWNFHTPHTVLLPGRYAWSYALWSEALQAPLSDWSIECEFEMGAGMVHSPGLAHAEREALGSAPHPRLWLNEAEVQALRGQVAADPQHLGWQHFMDSAVQPWVDREPLPEPARYPGNQRTPALWRQMYIDCQEMLYAVRHLAVAGRVLADARLQAQARQWLLHLAHFDLRGTTSRSYNDEAAFRLAGALAWGYDWLHDVLEDDERAQVRQALGARLEEVATHVIEHARIHLFPYDSHAVRSVASVMVPACIALLGEHPRAQEWLNFAIDYYDTLYSPWGDADGGWAEGPHYWTTAMAYMVDAGNLLRKFTGHDVFRRVFFQHTGHFPLYTKAPDTRRSSFGDDSTLGDVPSLKVGYNARHFAAVTGDGTLQWYFEEICRRAAGTEGMFYNHGWWSFAFDDLQHRHDWPAVQAVEPRDLPRMKHFRGIGWVAVQRDLHDPLEHLQFSTKCSPYGSISHSHGDQGGFLLFAHGEELAIQSGYYVGHGTSMHRHWRRLTKSKNAILIDGLGQYAGADKAKQIQAAGRVLAAEGRAEGTIFISLDPTEAYRLEVPYLKSYRRDFHLIRGRHLLVIDEVELDQEGQVQWQMQLLAAPQLGQNSFRHEGSTGGISGEFVFCSAGAPTLSALQGFDDVDPEDFAGQPVHHRVVATTPRARSHSLVTLLTPYRRGHQDRLHHFIDDQGFATHLYFQDARDRSYQVTLPKRF